MGISAPAVWDLETHENELTSVYSPVEVRRFAAVLGMRAGELLGIAVTEPPLTPTELAGIIRDHCRSKGISVEEFEDAAGWKVVASVDEPRLFLEDYSIDGIQHICHELKIDWQRFANAL